MKKNNVYKLNENEEVKFDVYISDKRALSIIQEIPKEKLSKFLSQSLTIGVTALNSAINQAQEVKLSDIADNLSSFLKTYKSDVTAEIENVIQNYLDPEKGIFEKRINNLINGQNGDGGEIGRLIGKQLRGPESPLEKCLQSIMGPDSPLFKNLDPENTSGVVQTIKSKIQTTLEDQISNIVKEFSLDKEGSALNRLITEIKKQSAHNDDNFQKEVGKIKDIFSYDNEKGVFTKLEKNINDQFKDIKEQLIKINVKKEIENNTTIQGNVFEDKVYYFAQDKFSDTCEVEKVGNRTGNIQRSKVGDVLLTLNSDSRGSGRKIIIEVKSDDSYTMNKARQELKTAKKNRGAEIGIFVFEKNRKPQDLIKSLHREGKDIYVCWDPEEKFDEAFLEASIQLSIALITQEQIQDNDQRETLETIKIAINSIEESIENIHKIESSSFTIENQITNIKKYTQKAKKNLNDEVLKLSNLI